MKKRNIIISAVILAALVFALATNAMASSYGSYSGSCTNNFLCNQTWNKINDKTLENANEYAKLYRISGGTECGYDTKFAVGSKTHQTVSSSGNRIRWANDYQGKCTLTIVNAYYAGTKLYAAGGFNLLSDRLS